MKVLDKKTKFAHLGKPGTVFSKGFERRLNKIIEQIDLSNKTILDQACGVGVWLERLQEFTSSKKLYGFDIDKDAINEFLEYNKLKQASEQIPMDNIVVSSAESLPFESNTFDVIISNEVFEHFQDDLKAAQEALRVLKPGGHLVIFTPNRGWPFETHGIFWREKYIWGNIPFVPWLPIKLRTKLAPHVRNYSNNAIRKVLSNAQSQNSKFNIKHHSHVFPAFDRLEKRYGKLGRLVQKVFHTLEKTPLHFFGISHFIALEKIKNS